MTVGSCRVRGIPLGGGGVWVVVPTGSGVSCGKWWCVGGGFGDLEGFVYTTSSFYSVIYVSTEVVPKLLTTRKSGSFLSM